MSASTYPIPESDRQAFDSLPKAVRAEIRTMLRIFWHVDTAPHGHRGAAWREAMAAANLTREDGEKVPKKPTLYNKRAAFRDSKMDWAVLIDGRKVTDWDAKLRIRTGLGRGQPEAFREYLIGLAQENGRSNRQAIAELSRRWKAGIAIPGYGIWTDWWTATFQNKPFPPEAPLPRGWDDRSLQRLLQDHKTELELARRGISSALPMLPGVIRTRAGLRFMEWVVLDDWRADFLVFVPGFPEPVELNGILAMDVASGRTLRFGLRPALPQEDGSHAGLKRMDAKSIICEMLLQWGYPRDYVMNVIVERGTATITPADAAAIEEATDGQVKIHWTSMISGTVFGWQDKPVGNFRGKAWLESFFNLLHNACASLPGQIGAHYQQRPARVAAQQAECTALLKAQEALPRDLRDTINYRMPFLDVNQARSALNFVFHFLNDRDDHNLEGFDRILKFKVEDTDPWRPVSLLIEKGWSREMILSVKPRPRLETPAERAAKLMDGVRFQTLSHSSAPALLAEHRLVTIEKDGEVNIGSASNPRLYRSRQNPHLKIGKKYLAHLSTQDDNWIHLTDQREGYVCSVAKASRIQHGDTEAAAAEIAAKTSQLKATVKEVNRLDANAPRRLADLDHNTRMLDEQLTAMSLARAPHSGHTVDVSGRVQGVLVAESAIAEHHATQAAHRERVRNTAGSYADLMPAAERFDEIADEEDAVPTGGMSELLRR